MSHETQKTVNVRYCGSMTPAYAEKGIRVDGSEYVIVRVYDDICGCYTTETTLTENQRKYVIRRTLEENNNG